MNGWKSYLVAAAMVILSGVHAVYPTILPNDLYQSLMWMLTGGGVAALRSGVKSEAKKVEDVSAGVTRPRSSTEK